jgi:hypothetical protein
MSSPAVGSVYSLLTFLLAAGAFIGGTHLLWGWNFPSHSRLETTVMLVYFLAAAAYAMLVGRHRDVDYGEALRRGAIDAGRKLKGMVMR